jgi:MFS family permease
LAGEGKRRRIILGMGRNALVVSVTEFIVTSGIFLTNSFWSLYVLALGASIAEFGLFNLVTGLLPALFVAPIGFLGDRLSRRKLMIVGVFIMGLGPLMNAFATDWVGLIPGTLLGAFFPVIRPVRQALVAEDIEPSERGKAFSTLFTLLMLPNTFLPPLAGVFLDLHGLETGMRYLLLMRAILTFLVVVLRFRFLREGRRSSNVGSRPQLNRLSLRELPAEMFRPLLSREMLRVMLAGSAVSAFSMGMMMQFQSVYAVEVIGLSNTAWGLIIAGVGVVRTLSRIPLGGLTDRWGRRRSILINYCLQPLFLLAFALSGDFTGLFVSMAARILAFNVGGAAWEAMLADVTPSYERGSVYGTMGTVEMVSRSVAPILGSTVWDTFSPQWIFLLAALGRVFSAGILLKFLREPEYREK